MINGVFVARGRNIAQEIIDEAHAADLRLLSYYWHITEDSVANLHREWICRHPDGTAIEHDPRGTHLDITGSYAEVVLTRLQELAESGADAIEFDERHLPPEGCWGLRSKPRGQQRPATTRRRMMRATRAISASSSSRPGGSKTHSSTGASRCRQRIPAACSSSAPRPSLP